MKVLTLTEVAGLMRCAPGTIYKAIKTGHAPPYFKVGSDFRFLADEVEKWMRQDRAKRAEQ